MNGGLQYTIRSAAKKDIPALLNVFQASVQHTAGGSYTPEQAEAWASLGTSARFLELFDRGLFFFIAESDSCCVGFTSVSGQGFLHSLFVAPEFHRRGAAAALLKKAIHWAKENGAENITAEVSIAAEPFFRGAGFAVIQEQKICVSGVWLNNFLMQLTV